MCRMIAKVSIAETSILEEMLMCPYSLSYLSENGRQPTDPEMRGKHHDGCGIAFAKNGNIEVHKRSKQDAWNDSYRNLISSQRSGLFIAHNRLASQGLEMSENGAHPFSLDAGGKTFALCHNGGIRTYIDEAIREQTSDSFLFLKKLIDISGNNDASLIFDRLREIRNQTSYSSLCAFLLSDNELFAWRIYWTHDLSKISLYEKYYTLYLSFRNDILLIAS